MSEKKKSSFVKRQWTQEERNQLFKEGKILADRFSKANQIGSEAMWEAWDNSEAYLNSSEENPEA